MTILPTLVISIERRAVSPLKTFHTPTPQSNAPRPTLLPSPKNQQLTWPTEVYGEHRSLLRASRCMRARRRSKRRLPSKLKRHDTHICRLNLLPLILPIPLLREIQAEKKEKEYQEQVSAVFAPLAEAALPSPIPLSSPPLPPLHHSPSSFPKTATPRA